MVNRLCARFFILCVIVVGTLSARADNWPQWRGPDGDGTSRETDLPIVWNESMGIRWKIPLPEWGNSTPAIWENSIFLTVHVNNDKLLLLKIDKETGHIEWTRQVARGPARINHCRTNRTTSGGTSFSRSRTTSPALRR